MMHVAQPVDAGAGSGSARLAFGLIIFGLLFAQKLALPFGGLEISVLVPLLLIAMAVLALDGCLALMEVRLGLFLLFLAACCLSQSLVDNPVSLPSLLLLLVLYGPACFSVSLPRDEWQQVLADFQRSVMILAAIVVVQLGWQQINGHGNTLNLERWVPDAFLLHGYVYDVPFRWGAQFVRPNGFFMLEPSFASLFLACGILIELQRPRPKRTRLAIFGGALIGTLAATGFMALAAGAPLILLHARGPVRLAFAGFALLAIFAAAAAGVLDVFAARLGEFGTPGTSAWIRFVEPFRQLLSELSDPAGLLTGIGAGNVSDAEMDAWPFLKLAVEYGVLTAVLFTAFLCSAVWASPVPAVLFAVFVVYSISGGYLLSPVVPLMLILLGSLPRPEEALSEPIMAAGVAHAG